MARTVGTSAEARAARLADQAYFKSTGRPVVGPNDAVPTPAPGGGIKYTPIDKAIRVPKRKVGDTGFKKVSGVENRYVQLVEDLKRVLKHTGIPVESAVIGGSGLLGAMNLQDARDLEVRIPKASFEHLMMFPGARLSRNAFGAPILVLRTPNGAISFMTERWMVGGRDFAENVSTKEFRGMKHWDLPTTLDFLRRQEQGKAPPTMKKEGATGAEEMLPLLAGLTLGFGTGRNLAGHAAAEIAPYGRKTRSEDVARKGAWLGAPAGSVAALMLAKKYGLTNKALSLLARKAPGGLVASPAAESALVRTMSPLALALAGGAAGGLATGGLTGLIQRLRGAPSYRRDEKKHASAEDVQRIFEDQNIGDEDIPLTPRSEGWKVVKEELEEQPGGMIIQKTTRVRTFGRLKKLAFMAGFCNEMVKSAAAADALSFFRQRSGRRAMLMAAAMLGSAGVGGEVSRIISRRRRKKDNEKQAADQPKMLIEPNVRKPAKAVEKGVEEDPFYRLRQKIKIVSGRGRGQGEVGTVPHIVKRRTIGKGLAL